MANFGRLYKCVKKWKEAEFIKQVIHYMCKCAKYNSNEIRASVFKLGDSTKRHRTTKNSGISVSYVGGLVVLRGPTCCSWLPRQASLGPHRIFFYFLFPSLFRPFGHPNYKTNCMRCLLKPTIFSILIQIFVFVQLWK